MRLKLQQLKKFAVRNPILFLSLLYLLFLPIYTGEIIFNQHAFIFGKYINYLHIRLSLHLIIGTALVGLTLYLSQKEKRIKNIALSTKVTGGIFLAILLVLPYFNIRTLPAGNTIMLYLSSVFHLFEYLISVSALVITIQRIFQSTKQYSGLILATLSVATAVQLFIGIAQFLLKGPLFPALLSVTGQPLQFTSNSFIGIFELSRIYGTTPHPNILAGILSLFLLITLSLEVGKIQKYVLASILGLLIVSTLSKAGLAALVIIIIMHGLRGTSRVFHTKKHFLVALFFLCNALVLISLGIIFKYEISQTFLSSRATIQQLYAELLSYKPELLLTGTGFTMAIPTLLANAQHLTTSTIWGNQILAEPPHNLLLLTIVEFGLVQSLTLVALASQLFSSIELKKWQLISLFSLVLIFSGVDHFLVY